MENWIVFFFLFFIDHVMYQSGSASHLIGLLHDFNEVEETPMKGQTSYSQLIPACRFRTNKIKACLCLISDTWSQSKSAQNICVKQLRILCTPSKLHDSCVCNIVKTIIPSAKSAVSMHICHFDTQIVAVRFFWKSWWFTPRELLVDMALRGWRQQLGTCGACCLGHGSEHQEKLWREQPHGVTDSGGRLAVCGCCFLVTANVNKMITSKIKWKRGGLFQKPKEWKSVSSFPVSCSRAEQSVCWPKQMASSSAPKSSPSRA